MSDTEYIEMLKAKITYNLLADPKTSLKGYKSLV